MGKATVTWVQELQFVGTDSTKHSVVVSAPDEANGIGMKPSELLLISLGACTVYDIVNILTKKRKKKTRRPGHLRIFTCIMSLAVRVFRSAMWPRRFACRTKSIVLSRLRCAMPSI